MRKPNYTLTRQAFWASFVLAWGVVLALVAGALMGNDQAVPMAQVVSFPMVVLIASLLGIHRAFGSIDMRTMASAPTAPEPEIDPRGDR